MTLFEFFNILYLHPYAYLLSLLISLLIFGFVMKRSTSSWLNPLRFNIFTFSIGISVVLFLYFFGYVSTPTFIYVMFSIAIFWFVFISIFKNKQRVVVIKFADEPRLAKYLFYLSYSLFIVLTLISYKLLGIPAFSEEGRLSTYTGSGLGFIARILPVLQIYSVIYIIHLFSQHDSFKRKIHPFILLAPILVIGVLTGSRSSFLVIVFAFWGYKTFYLHKEPKVFDYKWLIYPMLFISILSFTINAKGDVFQAIYLFFERIIGSGDLYWEALPYETWSYVIVEKPFEFILMGFLGPLRILNPTLAEIPIGYQLTSIIYPSHAGNMFGPVALFPIFGLVCFGYIGGLIFSFIQAVLASFLIKISFIRSNSIIISSMFYFTFNNSLTLIADISSGLGSILEVIISYLFIALLLMLISVFLYPQKILLIILNRT